MTSRFWFFALTMILAVTASFSVYGQGGRPQLPPQSQAPIHIPPNVGSGQPSITPGPNDHANPRALDGAGNSNVQSNTLESNELGAASVDDVLGHIDGSPLQTRITEMYLPLDPVSGLPIDLQVAASDFRNFGQFLSTALAFHHFAPDNTDAAAWELFKADVLGSSLGAGIQSMDETLTPDEADQAANDAQEEGEGLVDDLGEGEGLIDENS